MKKLVAAIENGKNDIQNNKPFLETVGQQLNNASSPKDTKNGNSSFAVIFKLILLTRILMNVELEKCFRTYFQSYICVLYWFLQATLAPKMFS